MVRPLVCLIVLALGFAFGAPAAAATMATSLDDTTFGTAHVGEASTTTRTLTISNTDTGGAAMAFTVTSGESEFVAVPDSGTVAPGASQEVTITFTPSGRGEHTSTLTVATPDDASNPEDTYELSGTGTSANMTVAWTGAPGALDFGTVAIGGATSQRTITVSNPAPANEPLLFSLSITAGGSDYAAPATTDVTVPVDGSVEITVTFDPSAAGTRTGTVTVTGDDALNPTDTVSLTGEGVQFAVSPTAIAFGTVLVGTSTSQTLTITNTAGPAAMVTSITSGTSVVTVTPVGGALPRTLAAGESMTATVTFTPVDGSVVSTSLSIATTGTPATLQVPVTGDGLYKAVTITAMNEADLMIDLGERRVGQLYTQVVTVTNTGETPQELALPTSDAAPCAVVPTSPATLPATLDPTDSATFEVRVTPAAVGAGTCTITITTDIPSTDTIVIDWQGVAPEVELTTPAAPAIDFGVIDVDDPDEVRTVVLRNSGSAPLAIGPCTITGSPRFEMVTSCTNLTIAPNASATLMVAFDPSVEASETASLAITVDALSTSSVVVALAGIGADQRLDLSALSVAFPDANVSESEAPIAYIDVFNPVNPDTGVAQTLHIESATTDNPVFTLANEGPFTVEAGMMIRLAITFRPTTAGTYEGALTLVSDASGQPMAVIALHGRGIAAAADESGGCCQSSPRSSVPLALVLLALLLRPRRRARRV